MNILILTDGYARLMSLIQKNHSLRIMSEKIPEILAGLFVILSYYFKRSYAELFGTITKHLRFRLV